MLYLFKSDKKNEMPKFPRDSLRESIETIIFVVMLVLLLKIFCVEAYVIPTGSMATTLLGFHKQYQCEECGHDFVVNSTSEVQPSNGSPSKVPDCTCPNCGKQKDFRESSPSNTTGDRVLVHKAWYHIEPPKRWDVVVFKYPENPQTRHDPMNYIKRLWGFGDETYAVHRGEVFVAKGSFPKNILAQVPDQEKNNYWKKSLSYRVNETDQFLNFSNTSESLIQFEQDRLRGFPGQVNSKGEISAEGFTLLRKPDQIAMAERRIVYDNDSQAKSLIKDGSPPRWSIDPKRNSNESWGIDDPKNPKRFSHTGNQESFIRYQHLTENTWVNPQQAMPAVIRNVIGYNSPSNINDHGQYWCGDLMLECNANITNGEVILELSKSLYRYQARFADGKVSLFRTDDMGQKKLLAQRPCPVSENGNYELRFANIDCRLRVWVNNKAIDFGEEADYPFEPMTITDPTDVRREGFTQRNDLEAPASIGAVGAVEFSHIKLWRDTVYTAAEIRRPENYVEFAETFYCPPKHYLVLGDNSAHSADSRAWGTVPDRLLLGRACFVFLPLKRFGFIK